MLLTKFRGKTSLTDLQVQQAVSHLLIIKYQAENTSLKGLEGETISLSRQGSGISDYMTDIPFLPLWDYSAKEDGLYADIEQYDQGSFMEGVVQEQQAAFPKAKDEDPAFTGNDVIEAYGLITLSHNAQMIDAGVNTYVSVTLKGLNAKCEYHVYAVQGGSSYDGKLLEYLKPSVPADYEEAPFVLTNELHAILPYDGLISIVIDDGQNSREFKKNELKVLAASTSDIVSIGKKGVKIGTGPYFHLDTRGLREIKVKTTPASYRFYFLK